jgi:outer membrane protein assembly factor BamB
MLRKLSLVALFVAGSVALAAPSGADATTSYINWSQNGAGGARHASSPDPQIRSGNVAQLALAAGGFANDCQCTMRPIISDGVVYSQLQAIGGARIEAWNEQTGAFLWATQVYHPQGNFAVSDGVVVAADFFGNMYGFSTVDGSQLWSSPSGGSSAQPVIANGVVYVTYGHIQALDLHTGAILWTGQPLDDLGASGPTVGANGTEVFQYAGNTIFAFDTSDGHPLWSTACTIHGAGGGHERSPMVLHGVVYEGAGCAVNATTGAPVWNIPTNLVSLTNDATGGSRVFTGYEWGTNTASYDRMAALDRTTGAVIWSHDEPHQFGGDLGEGPIVANGLVYFTDNKNGQITIKAFDTRTGKLVWKSPPVTGVYGISIADGRVWATFWNDNLIRYWARP